MSDNQSIETIVRELYEARQAKKNQKARMEALAAKNFDPEHGPVFCNREDYDKVRYGPCYTEDWIPRADWCAICSERQPIWEEYQRQTHKATSALRAVLRLGKKLSEGEE